MKNANIAILITSLAQAAGLIGAIAGGPVGAMVAGIGGFAAIVNLFLPYEPRTGYHKKMKIAAAICGVGLIIFATLSLI